MSHKCTKRSVLWPSKYAKIRFRSRLCPGHRWGSSRRSRRPLAGEGTPSPYSAPLGNDPPSALVMPDLRLCSCRADDDIIYASVALRITAAEILSGTKRKHVGLVCEIGRRQLATGVHPRVNDDDKTSTSRSILRGSGHLSSLVKFSACEVVQSVQQAGVDRVGVVTLYKYTLLVV